MSLTYGITWILDIGIIFVTHFISSDMVITAVEWIAGCSPTIAVFVLIKKFGQINGRSKIAQFFFDFPRKALSYIIILMFLAWRVIVFYAFGNIANSKPLYMIVPYFLLQIIFQGGLEEPGWRGFLQPLFERKYNFILAAVFVSVVWAIWHIPLWFIPGSAQNQMNFAIFYLQILVNTLSLTAIAKTTKSIAFCMIYHAGTNTVFLMIPFSINIGIIIAYMFEAAISLTICLLVNKKESMRSCGI